MTSCGDHQVFIVSTYQASKLAREGQIRNLVPCYGIQDRGDGQGGLGLATKPEDFAKVMGESSSPAA